MRPLLTNPTGLGLVRLATLGLLVLYPIAWFAPLLRAGIDLPLFGLKTISIASGIRSLWQTDIILAGMVTVFAIIAPYLKTIGTALIQWGVLGPRLLPAIQKLSKLAMADIFLIALYITVVKGVGLAKVEVAWGFYLFSFCIFLGMLLGFLTLRNRPEEKA